METDTNEARWCSEYLPNEDKFEQKTYLDLLLTPIYIIIAVCYLLTFFITLLRLLLWKKKCSFAKKFREADRKMIAYMLETFFNMLHHREGIRDLENKKEVINVEYLNGEHLEMENKKEVINVEYLNGEHIEMDEVLIHEGRVCTTGKLNDSAEISHSTIIDTDKILRSKWAVTILSWYIANITSLALVVFWDVFILEEKFGCNDDLHCFYENGTYISQYCSCLSIEDKRSASCYEVSLEFPKAIAEVAGILFLAFNGFAFLMFIKLLVVDGIASQCLRILLYLLLAIIEYLVVFGIIGAFVARRIALKKEDSTNIMIEQMLISVAMIMGVTTPWCMLLWAVKRVI